MIVKICGVTRPEDAVAATRAGADWLGLNFWPRSKRAVDRERARACARAAREAAQARGRSVALVGVFVNQEVDEMAGLAAAVGLDFVQLHGDEPPALVAAVRAACRDAGCGPGVGVIRALALRTAADVATALTHVSAGADVLLVDAPSAGYGGSGHTGDWALARALVAAASRPVILAGGLAAHNVAAAVVQVGPAGVDVASGVESAPGIKDSDSMHAFVQAARAARRAPAGAHAPVQQQASMSQEASMSEATSTGRFGVYGGQYVAETLMPAVTELAEAYREARTDPAFQEELGRYLRDYVGRPSPLTFAPNLSREAGPQVYLKREDLNHTGAHKINNCVGQALLARRMGKRRLIAETGAGQHGVATATVAAMLGMTCDVYMGAEDVARQSLNVFRMKLLGARVIPVGAGTRTLKDAMNEALRDWVTNVADTYYLIGSVAGPHPYPVMVRDFQAVIGQEVRNQILTATGRLPDALVACVGGGSNAAGLFAPFVDDIGVAMFGVEAAGSGIDSGRHAATLSRGRVGVLHGSKSYVLCDEQGQITEAHSISAGLDYPGVGPEHAHWKDTGRVTYVSRTDDEALEGLKLLARTEGILCALETAHAVAALAEVAGRVGPQGTVVLGLSGRGDKDMITVARHLGVELGVNDSPAQHGPSGPGERPRMSDTTTGSAGKPGQGRIQSALASAAASRRAALVVYLTAGDPSPADTVDIVLAAHRAGADIIELGVPFSDPSADGVVIQEAMQRALHAGGSLTSTLASVAALRRRGCEVPIVLFGYYNPIFVHGVERFAADAAAAGVDAVLTVDLPVDEMDELRAPLARQGVGVVPLVAPTTGPERMARVRALAPPFVYYISMTGITGAAFRGAAGGPERVAALREAVGAPVAVGFGIKTADDAVAVAAYADGVVVGSAVVQRIAEVDPGAGPGAAASAVASFVGELRQALERSTR